MFTTNAVVVVMVLFLFVIVSVWSRVFLSHLLFRTISYRVNVIFKIMTGHSTFGKYTYSTWNNMFWMEFQAELDLTTWNP